MFKNKIFFISLAVILITQYSYSQNNTNSPYTRFGYGKLSDTNSGEQRAMGGLAIGSRSSEHINTVNPASYSSVDSMRFMFDLGSSALLSRFTEPGVSKKKLNANLEYVTMQFPIFKNVGFSAGLLPYSFSGYSFYTQSDLVYGADTTTATETFSGIGGISQVYAGLAVKLFKQLSLGMNMYYMFGSSVNARALTFSSTDNFYPSYQSDSISVNSLRFRFGLQYFKSIDSKHDISVGLIYEPKMKLNAIYSERTGSVVENATPYQQVFSEFETPELIGAGVNYTINKQLTVGVDYNLQKWANAKFFGVTDTLNNRSKFIVGAQYIPDPRGSRYYQHIRYRAGFNLSDPYYKVNGQVQPKNIGITFGLGFPLINNKFDNKTVINTSFEYGKIGNAGTLREDYFKLTFNATFNENWFFKIRL